MVTKKQLEQEAKEQKERKAKRKAELDASWKAREKEWLEEDIARAKGLLNGKLGKLLQKLNADGERCVYLTRYKVYKKKGKNELYDYESPLDFKPEPNYKPTKIVLKALRKAGFDAEIVSQELQNYKTIYLADGNYEYEYTGGTHTKYYLKISW